LIMWGAHEVQANQTDSGCPAVRFEVPLVDRVDRQVLTYLGHAAG
jgi:hypothetical protein